MDISTIARKSSLLTAIIFCFVVVSLAQDAKTQDNSLRQTAPVSKAAPISNSTDGKALPADPSRMSSMAVKANTARTSQNTNTGIPANGSGATDNNKVNVVSSSSGTVSPQFNARQKATAGTKSNINPNNK
jgi:hypothetical protein